MLTLKPQREKKKVSLPVQIVGALLLIALLFAATTHNEALYRVFGGFWQRAFALLGIARHVPSIVQSGGAIGQITNQPRDIPAVITYSLFYVAICLLLLFVLLPQPLQRKQALMAYGAACGAFLLLMVLGKLGIGPALVLGSQLIHFIVSPMPVIVLAPLLVWTSRMKPAA